MPSHLSSTNAKDDPGPATTPVTTPVTTPAPAPAGPKIKRTIRIFPVSLGSSTRSPYPDIAKADSVWRQCGVAVSADLGVCSTSDVLDKLAPKDVLNEFTNNKSPTSEEIEMVGLQPGGTSTLHAYYVPKLSNDSRGENIRKGNTPKLPEAVVVGDGAVSDTLAHELGHILLGEGDHHPDRDNLMAKGKIRNVGVDKLEPEQCAKV